MDLGIWGFEDLRIWELTGIHSVRHDKIRNQCRGAWGEGRREKGEGRKEKGERRLDLHLERRRQFEPL